MFLHVTLQKSLSKIIFFAYAHKFQPLSHLHISLYFAYLTAYSTEISTELSGISFRECTAQNCSDLPPHSHCQSIGLSPLFHRIMVEHIFFWFLTFETAMLQVYSKRFHWALKKCLLQIRNEIQPIY